jgi:hypothetical protein
VDSAPVDAPPAGHGRDAANSPPVSPLGLGLPPSSAEPRRGTCSPVRPLRQDQRRAFNVQLELAEYDRLTALAAGVFRWTGRPATELREGPAVPASERRKDRRSHVPKLGEDLQLRSFPAASLDTTATSYAAGNAIAATLDCFKSSPRNRIVHVVPALED